MDALPADWDGALLMVDHMAGFVSKCPKLFLSDVEELAAKVHDT